VDKLFSLEKDLKSTKTYIGSKMKEEEYKEVKNLLESGKNVIVFYTSLIHTESYLTIIKKIITQIRDQIGKLKVCCIFSDENSSKDLGRYDNVELFTIYYSNYLKMFQIMFDPEEAACFEKIVESTMLKQ
jgi:hypothetical protein